MPDAGWLLLRNEAAGSDDEAVVERVAAGLAAHGGAEVVVTGDAGDVDRALRAAGGRVVVVCGGDGSVQLAVERGHRLGLLDELVFGIVPLGTGNDLATSLDLRRDPDLVVPQLANGTAKPMDLLVTSDDAVVVNAVHVGIGVDAAERAAELKGAVGALAYPVGAMLAGVAAEGLDLRVHLGGERLDRGPVLMVAVANGRTIGGGTPVAPDAEPDDGQLDVVVVHAVEASARAAFAAALLGGGHVDREDVTVARGAAVRIAGAGLSHNRDGELEDLHGDECTYRVVPGAWRLLR